MASVELKKCSNTLKEFYYYAIKYQCDQLEKLGWDREDILPQLTDLHQHGNVLEIHDGDKMVGWVEIKETPLIIVVPFIFIKDDYKRKGYASLVSDKLLEMYPGKPIHSIVSANNTSSINFHQKNGYRIIGYCMEKKND